MRNESSFFLYPLYLYTNDIIIQGVDNSDDSDNTSSVATAQMPVPTIRGSTRRGTLYCISDTGDYKFSI